MTYFVLTGTYNLAPLGRLNQWAHWARAHAAGPPDFFFLFEGPQLAVVKYFFKTDYLFVAINETV